MGRARTFALALLWFALPSVGSATELHLRTFSNISFDTGDDNSQQRTSYRISTPIEIRTAATGRYQAALDYRPSLSLDWRGGFGSSFNHLLDATGSYSLTRRSRVSGAIEFQDLEYTSIDTPDRPDATPNEDDGSQRATTQLRYDYELTPRSGLGSSFFVYAARFNDSNPNRTDSTTLGGSVDYNYLLSKRDQLGLTVQTDHSQFESSGANQGEQGQTQGEDVTNLNLSVHWSHNFSKNLSMQFNLGPTFTFSKPRPFPDVAVFRYPLDNSLNFQSFDPDNCDIGSKTLEQLTTDPGCTVGSALGPIPLDRTDVSLVSVFSPATGEQQVNYFGRVGVNYSRQRWNFGMGFRRTQSNDSGLGRTSAVNTLDFNCGWQATNRWHFRFSTQLSRRKSLTSNAQINGQAFIKSALDLNGNPVLDLQAFHVAETRGLDTSTLERPVDVKRANVRLEVNRIMSPRLRFFGRASYNYHDRRVDTQKSKYSRYRIEFGVNYSFRPVRL